MSISINATKNFPSVLQYPHILIYFYDRKDDITMPAHDSTNNTTLVEVISAAVQIPGVKVNRESFLLEQFKTASPELRNKIIEFGPVKANCSRSELRNKAQKLVNERTLASSSASFLAGLPGGLALAATIPADTLQYYGVALRLAQEIAYLYGEEDLWCSGALDSEKVTNQLILYCGVMFGVSGASQTIRVLSSKLAQNALKKLPQKALTKTFYYPIIKSIVKTFGGNMTKEVFAKGVSKTVPIVGGFISGGITLATMRPMGMRLVNTLEEAHFTYSQADFEADWQDITKECDYIEASNDTITIIQNATENTNKASLFDEINQAKQLLDAGIISDQEFTEIKTKIIAKM